jgi:F-type H+-transporting ATPase subunit delta
LAERTLQAKRYSQAIFEIAKEHNTFDKWQENLQKIAVLTQDSEFVAVMENPKFSVEEKFKLLNTQLKNIDPMALNLAYILTSKGIFGLVRDVYTDYQKILDDFRGIDQAEITTAIPLNEKERQQLAARLSAITGRKIIMTMHVDPEIIGGVIAKVGEKMIDGSTRSQLAALKNELASAGS